MTQNLLELAKQGDPQAIASLMNRSLQPKGMTATVELQGDTLWVWLEASQTPNRQVMTLFVQNGIQNLGVEHIHMVKVAGKQTGADSPAWTQEIHFESAEAITPLGNCEATAPASVVLDPEPGASATVEPPSEIVSSPIFETSPGVMSSNGLDLDDLDLEMDRSSSEELIDFSDLEASPGLDEENLGMDSTDLDFSELTDDEPIPTINLLSTDLPSVDQRSEGIPSDDFTSALSLDLPDLPSEQPSSNLNDASDDFALNLSDADFFLESEAPTTDPQASTDENWLGDLTAVTEVDSVLDLGFLEEPDTTASPAESFDFGEALDSPNFTLENASTSSASSDQDWNLDLPEGISDEGEGSESLTIEEDWSLDLPTVPNSEIAATDETDWSFDLTEPPAVPTEPQLSTDTEDWSFDLPEPPTPSEPVASTEEDWSFDLTEPSVPVEPVASTEEDWSFDLTESSVPVEPVALAEEDWSFDLTEPSVPVEPVASTEEDWSFDLTEPSVPVEPVASTEEDWSFDLTEPSATAEPVPSTEEEWALDLAETPVALESDSLTEEDWSFDLTEPSATAEPVASTEEEWALDLPDSPAASESLSSVAEEDWSLDLTEPPSTPTELVLPTEETDWSFDMTEPPATDPLQAFEELETTATEVTDPAFGAFDPIPPTEEDWAFDLDQPSASEPSAFGEELSFDLAEPSTTSDFSTSSEPDLSFDLPGSAGANVDATTAEVDAADDWSFDLPESSTTMDFPETGSQADEFDFPEPTAGVDAIATDEDWSFDLMESSTVMDFPETPPDESADDLAPASVDDALSPADEEDWSFDLPESSTVIGFPETTPQDEEFNPQEPFPLIASSLPADEEDWSFDLPAPPGSEPLVAADLTSDEEDWSLDLPEPTVSGADLSPEGIAPPDLPPDSEEDWSLNLPDPSLLAPEENLAAAFNSDEDWSLDLSASPGATAAAAGNLFDDLSGVAEEPSPLELAEFVPPTEENFSTDENFDTGEDWRFDLSDGLTELAPPVVPVRDEPGTEHLLDLSQLDLPSAAPIEAIADDLQADEDLTPEAFALDDEPALWENELLASESDLPVPFTFIGTANVTNPLADLQEAALPEPAALMDDASSMEPLTPSAPVSPYEEDDLLFDQSGEEAEAVSDTRAFTETSFADSDGDYTSEDTSEYASEYANGAVSLPAEDTTEEPSEELQATDFRVYPEESSGEASSAAAVAAKDSAPSAANRSGGMLFWIVLMVLVGWIGGLLTATLLRSRQPIPTPPPQTVPQSMTLPTVPSTYVGPV